MVIHYRKPLCILVLLVAVSFLPSFNPFVEAQPSVGALFFSPATVSLKQGDTVRVDVKVDTAGEAVNAVAAYFSYPTDKLEALGVNTAGSVMQFFAEQKAASGLVHVSGGKPTPGFSGVQKIASVGFKAKASSGTVTLAFRLDSAVLRDSDNQNILNLASSGSLIVTFDTTPPPTPVPTPVPGCTTPNLFIPLDGEIIYERTVRLMWDAPSCSDITGYTLHCKFAKNISFF